MRSLACSMGNRRLIPLVLFLIIGTCTAHSRATSRRGLSAINSSPSSSEANGDVVSWKVSSREPDFTTSNMAPQDDFKADTRLTARTIHAGQAQRRSRNSGVAAAHGGDTRATFRMASSSDVTIRHHNSPGIGRWTVRDQGGSGTNGGAGRRLPTGGSAQDGALHHATRGSAQRHPSRGGSSHQLQRNGRQQQHVGFHMATAEDVALPRHMARSDDESSFARAADSNYGMNRGGANYYHGDDEYRGSDHAGDDNNENDNRNENNSGGDGRLDVNCDGEGSNGGGDASNGGGDASNGGGDASNGGGVASNGGGDASNGGGDASNGGGDASNGGGDASNGDGGSSSGGGSGGVDVAAILEVHNRARQEVGVPDLAWDDGVAAAAQDWANQLAGRGCPMEHGGAGGLGQNLYWRTPAELTPEEDRMAVQAWVGEKADWTPSPIPDGCAEGKMCGHYTQVVWRDTTHRVAGAASDAPDGGGPVPAGADGPNATAAATSAAAAAAPAAAVSTPADVPTSAPAAAIPAYVPPPHVEAAWAHFRRLGSPRLLVAPMVDQSELPFRRLCAKYGAQGAYTPMFHSRLFVEDHKYRREFTTCPEDRPLFVQFCANNPDTLVKAASLVAPDSTHCTSPCPFPPPPPPPVFPFFSPPRFPPFLSYSLLFFSTPPLPSAPFWPLSLLPHLAPSPFPRCSCPQRIARRGRYGAFLMDDLPLVESLVSALSAARLPAPVSCKIRVFPDLARTIAYARMLEAAGCYLLAVHGRTREQKDGKKVRADWEMIRRVKESVSIPVIANGNIRDLADVVECLEATGCDGVLSAESLLENPALFGGYRVDDGVERGQANGGEEAHLHRMLGPVFSRHPHIREKLNKEYKLTVPWLLDLVGQLRACEKGEVGAERAGDGTAAGGNDAVAAPGAVAGDVAGALGNSAPDASHVNGQAVAVAGL
ncbi:unnamed protein product [Closterium sp. Naga37s-1]|nr:unnamed protein product [Closterium sp. Naga37s-1]